MEVFKKMKAIFGRTFLETNKKSEKEFYVNNCGYYLNVNSDFNIRREHGRLDYQIIYILAGALYITEASKKVYTKGSLIIFRPGEPQIYSVRKEDNTSYFWIHFSGTYADKILNQLKISERAYFIPEFYEFCDLCKKAVNECSAEDPNEILISSTICAALASVGKKISGHHKRFDSVIKAIQRGDNLSTEELSELCGLSVYHFIREFRKEYGITPYAYITKQRLEKSKYMLSESDISIKKAAELAGFSDPLYFSRLFKKHVGISPKTYRETIRQQNVSERN